MDSPNLLEDKDYLNLDRNGKPTVGGAVSKEVTIFTGEITIIRKQRGSR